MENIEIKFLEPKAFNGDKVYVHNYKRKTKNADGYMVDGNIWEWGIVSNVETGWYRNPDTMEITFRHAYEVVLDRVVKNKWGEWSQSLRVTVNDNGLQTVRGE